jgi:hypothetical protein
MIRRERIEAQSCVVVDNTPEQSKGQCFEKRRHTPNWNAFHPGMYNQIHPQEH